MNIGAQQWHAKLFDYLNRPHLQDVIRYQLLKIIKFYYYIVENKILPILHKKIVITWHYLNIFQITVVCSLL